MIINETQNNAVICAEMNSSFIIELTAGFSRLGGVWAIKASPGLQILDESSIWYDDNGSPTARPGMGRGVDRWNFTINESGLQTIHADLQFPGRKTSVLPFDLKIVVK